MFLKQSIFKRLLKEAYKGAGLTVGRQRDEDATRPGYHLSGGYWIVWLDVETIPKEAKAAIIELVGDLPEPGEVFRAMKDAGNQYEIEQKEIFNLPEAWKNAKVNYKITNSILQQGDKLARILQTQEGPNHITAINEVFVGLVDPEACDYDNGETFPDGPRAICAEAPFVYWGNNVCYLMAGIRKPMENTRQEEFFKHLEGFEME